MSQPEHSGFPKRYGKYDLLEKIGEGGMAEVFRARLPGAAGFEKILVVKRILPHLAQRPDFVRMFVDEAKLAARIQHQNVVQVFELGETEDGELYMAMEYVSGADLRGLIHFANERRLRIPTWFVLHVMSEVLNGLAYAHELIDPSGQPLQVVHRDVTPGNIFISYQGEVKLADFGIAKAVGRVSETEAGQVKGNMPYMSPEALFGHPLDVRTDVFSAGVVLWESLTGRLPFEGSSNYETARLICEARRDPVSRFNPDVPPELDAVVLQVLERDREKRIPSAREFQARLVEVLVKVRPKLLPADVRSIVEVLSGRRAPDVEFAERAPMPQHYVPLPRPSPASLASLPEISFKESTVPEPSQSSGSPMPIGLGIDDELMIDLDLDLDYPVPSSVAAPALARSFSSDPRPAAMPRAHPVLSPSVATGAGLVPTAPLSFSSEGRELPLRDVTPPNAPAMAGPQRAPVRLVSIAEFVQEQGRQPVNPPQVEAAKLGAKFFVRYRDGSIMSARTFDDFVKLCDPHSGNVNALSPDERTWIELPTFAKLAGMEYLIQDYPALRKVTLVGALEERSLVSLFGHLARKRETGKLVLLEKGTSGVARREIDIVNGAPSYVYSDNPSLQFPRLYVQHDLINKDHVQELIHQVLVQRVSLEEIVRRQALLDLNPYRAVVMRDRLAEIFSWRFGRFAFDSGAELRWNAQFAPSLIRVLPDALLRGYTADELRQKLERVIELKLKRTQGFDAALTDLGLKEKLALPARRLGQRHTLAQLLKKHPAEVHMQLLAAFLLIELDVLVPVRE